MHPMLVSHAARALLLHGVMTNVSAPAWLPAWLGFCDLLWMAALAVLLTQAGRQQCCNTCRHILPVIEHTWPSPWSLLERQALSGPGAHSSDYGPTRSAPPSLFRATRRPGPNIQIQQILFTLVHSHQ